MEKVGHMDWQPTVCARMYMCVYMYERERSRVGVMGCINSRENSERTEKQGGKSLKWL